MTRNRIGMYALSLSVCLLATLLSLCLGAANLSLGDLVTAIARGPRDTAGFIFYYVRLPRTAACLLSGAALAVAGGVIQGVLCNSLASPTTIGVNSGAALAVTVCCALGFLSGWAIALAAFLGAMACVLTVMFTAKKIGASRTTVILGGVAVSSFFSALCEAVTTLVPEAGVLSSDFRVGGFSSVSYPRLIPAGILILVALALVMTLRNELEVLSLGEDTARSLGMRVSHMRTLLLILAAMLSGASVSFAGLLGFVGLIVPHTVRKMPCGESRDFLPLCALLGATLVTLCDIIARMAFAPYELPVGILLSVLGGPFFLWLLIRKKGGKAHD